MLRCFALRDLLKRQMINGTLNVGTRDGDIRFTISFPVRESDRPAQKSASRSGSKQSMVTPIARRLMPTIQSTIGREQVSRVSN